MLEQLSIFDFQGHAKLTLKFDKRVTTIIGPSDAGKSAIIRALRWICLNKPSGMEFIRHGSKTARAQLKADGHVIRRLRSKNDNQYLLDGDPFLAFRDDVPPDIQKVLGVDEINFQGQHDAPFWLALSPPEVSRRLNSIIDLSIIDNTLNEVASQLRKAKTTLEVCEDRLQQARATVKNLTHVDRLNQDLAIVEARWADYMAAQAQRNQLNNTLFAVDGVAGRQEARDRARKTASNGQTLLTLAGVWHTRYLDRLYLVVTIKKIQELKAAVGIKLPNLKALDDLKARFDLVESKRIGLAAALQNLRVLWVARRNTRKAYETIHNELHALGDTCPMCHGTGKL